MGGNAFCFKVCDPKGPHAADYCQHIYDRIGCAYNAPNQAQNGTFEACEGENQDFPGVYTTNGAVVTYTQPPESLGPITSIPFTARIPASSNCVTHASSELFASLPTPTNVPAPAVTSASVVVSTGSGGTVVTSTLKPASPLSTHSASGSGPASATNTSNDASAVAISGVSVLGVLFAALFLS